MAPILHDGELGTVRSEEEAVKSPLPRERGSCHTSNWRKWLSRLALVVLSPVICITLIEVGLRVFGYGYSTDFLIPAPNGMGYIGNERFAWRFTPPKTAPEPEPFVLTKKQPGTIRIFVLGESAAMGAPRPAYSFGRMLRVMLREQYPQGKVEVVNAAMRGINSHAILPIARDCARHEPDLFIIYAGNNEVGGFLGPTGVAKGQSLPNLTIIRLGLWARSMRLGQLLHDTIWGERPPEKNTIQVFLDHQVAADDPRRQQAAEVFRANLRDIIAACRSGGAKVVVCTVAVNLRDCAPFGSLHREGLGNEEKSRWDALWTQANRAAGESKHAEAIEAYQAASKVDDRHAELHFRLAQSLWAAGRCDEAAPHYRLARDLDTINFRTDSVFNQVIRDVASGREAEGVYLADVEKAMEREAEHGVPGGSSSSSMSIRRLMGTMRWRGRCWELWPGQWQARCLHHKEGPLQARCLHHKPRRHWRSCRSWNRSSVRASWDCWLRRC